KIRQHKANASYLRLDDSKAAAEECLSAVYPHPLGLTRPIANTKFLTIDLSSGALGSVGQADVIIGSKIETPWEDALELRECEIAVDKVPGNEMKRHLVVLMLPSSIGRDERDTGDTGSAQPTRAETPVTLVKDALVPRRHETAEILMADLNPLVYANAASEIISPTRVSFRYKSGRDSQIQHLMLALRAELDEGCPAGRLFGEFLATTLAVHLLRHYAVFPGKMEVERLGLPRRRLHTVVDYIETHLSDDVSLRQLADLAQMSQFRFGHLFKQSTGLSPHQYLLRRRIAKAKSLLVGGNLTLADISLMLGFASQ